MPMQYKFWHPKWLITNQFFHTFGGQFHDITSGRWVNNEYVYYPTTETPIRLH